MALETSPETALPVREISRMIGEWIGRLGQVWVEGQVTQITRRPGAKLAFITLRDPQVDASLSVTVYAGILDKLDPALREGAAVVVHAKPSFYPARGQLSLAAREIRPMGIGELLARLEQLKTTLRAEGLFAPERKKPLPFLPRTIGLICGRASAAEQDVRQNVARRWPSTRFATREVVVQGALAVEQVCQALAELDANPDVEVIIIARGGGSVEDLLPFSDERLVRAVAAATTPVISAIGHEVDTPLLDYVADLRASTPTDAAKRVVPDQAAEQEGLAAATARLRQAVLTRLHREQTVLGALRSRPVLREPAAALTEWAGQLAEQRQRLHQAAHRALLTRAQELTHLQAQLRALSPQATLERGYALVQQRDGRIVTDPSALTQGQRLQVRVAQGSFAVLVDTPTTA